MALNVLKLKNIVPTSCINVDQQSIRFGSQKIKYNFLFILFNISRGTLADSRYCKYAAEVKKIDPAKKVKPSRFIPTYLKYAGIEPKAKREEPIAKRIPIHHVMEPGAHQVEPEFISSFLLCLR